MSDYTSALKMEKIVFERIEFERTGFENDNELELELKIQMGVKKESYKVNLVLTGNKKDEYQFEISLSGFFLIEGDEKLGSDLKNDLISKNTVAILMPYLRSEVSLLTAQPGMESVVLPVFNVSSMLEASPLKCVNSEV